MDFKTNRAYAKALSRLDELRYNLEDKIELIEYY